MSFWMIINQSVQIPTATGLATALNNLITHLSTENVGNRYSGTSKPADIKVTQSTICFSLW